MEVADQVSRHEELRGAAGNLPRVVPIVADLLRYEPEARFDAIICCRIFQTGFSAQELDALVRRFHRWLRPGGICLIGSQNLVLMDGTRALEERFQAAGFHIHSDDLRAGTWAPRCDAQHSGPGVSSIELARSQLEVEPGAQVGVTLDDGEKIAAFYHASG